MKKCLLFFVVAVFTIESSAQAAPSKKPQPKPASTQAKKAASKSSTEKKPATSAGKPAQKIPQTTKASVKAGPKRPDTKTAAKTNPKPKPPPVRKDDKGELDKAISIESPDEKIAALVNFLAEFPKSNLRPRAMESLTAARAASGELKFDAGEREQALALYRLAVSEAPVPYPERLFTEVLSKIPLSLYARGEQASAFETASTIVSNSADSPSRLLAIAGFYLLTENGDEAKRLAEAALKLDERSAMAYQTIGMAHRLNFDLEGSAAAFERSLELDPDSRIARRSLAEMKRALGKPKEALSLFEELIAKDPEDLQSVNGRILSLFSLGKKDEAESELSKAILDNPLNVPLLAGTAYWYAAAGESTRAIDMAGKAIAADPRFIWSHIALGRAMLAEGRFSEAEQVLLNARKYGNFATLEYEIASARLAGGFYREAYEELRRSFSVRDGMVSTKLGRRIERTEKGFIDLVAYERKASILEPNNADTVSNAETLKALLDFSTAISAETPDPAKAAETAEAFVKGADKMRFHRQVYAANELLEKKLAPAKAFELSRAAVASVEDGLNVSLPAAPIMASELYSSRTAAINTGRYVLVPEVSKQTLSVIARGRIEEIAGWSLLLQGSNDEAVVRLKRAVSILPEKSAWWRSSHWRLGQALEAIGKDKEALEAFTKSYLEGDPDGAKYAVIKSIYRRTNESLDGLEALIGVDPAKPKVETEKNLTEAETVLQTQTITKNATEEPDPTAPVEETKSATTTKENSESLNEMKKPDVEKKESDGPPAEVKKPESEGKTELKRTAEASSRLETESKRPIFEPVVIEIKRNDGPEEKKPDKSVGSVESKMDVEAPARSGSVAGEDPSVRPRIVEGRAIKEDGARKPCKISLSQESVSLIGEAGSIGILASLEGSNDTSMLSARSLSPTEVEVTPEDATDPAANSRAFVVRSLTPAIGVYQVVFTAPCGRKELLVKVR